MGVRAALRIASVLVAGALAAGGTAATAVTGATVAGSGFVSYGPTRFLDTRSGLGTGAPGAVAPFGTVRLAVGGVAGLPADVSAVVMNVTVTNPTVGGFITVYPDGGTRPLASNLNFTAGQTVPNLTMIPVGANGFVDLYNGSPGSSDLIADITGYYTRSGGAGYVPAGVFRVFDTRTGEGTDSGVAGPVPAGAVLPQTIVGRIPTPRGATAIVLTVMATQPQGPGFVTVYSSGTSRPVASNLNFVAGQTIANTVVVPIGADGKINFYAHSTTHLVVDEAGFFVPGNRNLFVPVTPVRKVDTRDGTGQPAPGAIPARGERAFQLMAGVQEPGAAWGRRGLQRDRRHPAEQRVSHDVGDV
jgi:hypothetical protein